MLVARAVPLALGGEVAFRQILSSRRGSRMIDNEVTATRHFSMHSQSISSWFGFGSRQTTPVKHAKSSRMYSERGESMLEAAKLGKLSSVRSCIAQGAIVDYVNEQGMTALMIASIHGHKDVADYLLTHGAYVDHTTSEVLDSSVLRTV
jgi:ankyrin repeat protein